MINTKVIKIGIIFISVILFLTAVLFFIGESYDRRKARDIAQQFYESYGRLNKQVIRELIPSEMMSDEHVAYFLSDEYFNSLEIIDYSLEAVKVTEVEKYDSELNSSKAYKVYVKYIRKYNQMGEILEDKKSTSIICGKVDNKWYVLGKGVFYIDSDIYDDFDKIVASDTVLKYVEGFRDKDIEKIKATVPEELSKAKGVDSIFNSEAEGKIKGLSYEIDKLVYLYTDVYDTKEAMSHISDKSGVKLDITDAYTINIGYILEADSGQVPLNRDIICGKVDGRWYVVDPDQLAHGINFATEYASDEVGRNDFSTITTLLKYDKVESKLGDVPEGMSNDPLDGNLSLNGSVHVIPFRVGDVAGGWKLDKHNLKEENKKLSPGEYAYSNSFRNMECRDFKGVTMTTLNMTDEEIAFEDSTVVGFDISLLYGDCDKEYPEVVLPKGITIGSSVTDIYNAYGEAENIYKGKLANWASVDYKFTETKDGVYRSYSYDIDVDFEHGVKDIHVFYFEF